MRLTRDGQLTFGRGVNDTANPTEYREDEVALLLNGRISWDGQAAEPRVPVADDPTSIISSAAGEIGPHRGWSATEFVAAGGTRYLVAMCGDKAFASSDDSATWSTIATGLPTGYWDFAQMRVGSSNYLIAAVGGSSLYYWDGSTWGTLTGAPSGVQFVEVFNDRLYAAGHSGPRVAFSAVGDPDDWTGPDAGSTPVTTHDDRDLTGLFQLGTVLLAFKRDSVSYLEGYGRRTLQVRAGARGISRSVGCVAWRSIAPAGDDAVMFLSERGFEYMRTGDVEPTLISRPVQRFMDALSWEDILSTPGIPTSTYLTRNHEYMCAVPGHGNRNTHVFIFRPPTGGATPMISIDRFDRIHFSTQPARGTVYVDENGYLVHLDNPDESVLAREQVRIDDDGYLVICEGNVPGQFTTGAGRFIALDTPDNTPAAFFTADDSDGIQQVRHVGYGGSLWKWDYGTDRPHFRVRTRPLLGHDWARRKRFRTVRVLAASEQIGASAAVRTIVDGAVASEHTVDLPVKASLSSPGTKKVRISARGYAAAVEIASAERCRIAGVDLQAQPLREAP